MPDYAMPASEPLVVAHQVRCRLTYERTDRRVSAYLRRLWELASNGHRIY